MAETEIIRVHYWAAAKSAAGVSGDDVATESPLALSEVVRRAAALHPGSRLPQVLETCSVLIGEAPVGSQDPDDVLVSPGSTVEFLPPFAGG